MPRLPFWGFFNPLFTAIFMNRQSPIRPVSDSTDRNCMAPGFARVAGDKKQGRTFSAISPKVLRR